MMIRIMLFLACLGFVLFGGVAYPQVNSSVELKTGFCDNLNLRNDSNRESGRITEVYLTVEPSVLSNNLRYTFSWMQNPALTILNTGYSLPEGKSIRNHTLTTKYKKSIPSLLSFEIKGQGEYNDADLNPLVYQKYSASGHIDSDLSHKSNAGAEIKYSRRFYNKTTPSRTDTQTTPSRTDTGRTASTNTSYVFPFNIIGYLEYQYTNNDSDNNYYTYRGYGPTGMITLPITRDSDLRIIASHETRNYKNNFTDRSLILSPSFINKRLNPVKIFMEYSYQRNSSNDGNRRFTQNKYYGGINISF